MYYLGKIIDMASNLTQAIGVSAPSNKIPTPNFKGPKHCIASCFDEDGHPLVHFMENLDQLLLDHHRSYLDVPVSILSVVGFDDKNTVALLTNWLIQYLEQDLSRAMPSGALEKVNHVKTLEINLGEPGCENGLYIWPKVYFLSGKLHVVLYSLCGNFDTMNLLCALMSSVIVTFKPDQKERIVKVLKRMSNANKLPEGVVLADANICYPRLSAGTREGYQRAWNLFINTIEMKPIPAKLVDKHPLTLRTLGIYLEETVKLLNDDIFKNLPVQVPRESNSPPRHVSPTLKYAPALQEKHFEDVVQETLEDAYNHLEDWIVNKNTISNFIEIPTVVHSTTLKREPELYALIEILLKLGEDFRKMHDNYVCFDGDRDCAQMSRLVTNAKETSTEAFFAQNIIVNQRSKSILSLAQSECVKVFEKYNRRILRFENSTADKACKKIIEAYEEMLKKSQNTPNLKKSEFIVIHERLSMHSAATLSNCMNYGGRLNNVVRQKARALECSLEDIFKEYLSNMQFPSEEPVTTPLGPNDRKESTLEVYDSQIREHVRTFNSVSSAEFHNANDEVLSSLLESTVGSDRDELEIRLRTHLSYLSEYFEQLKSGASKGRIIGIFATFDWAWLSYYTKSLGSDLMTGPNSKENSSGFQPILAWDDTGKNLIYGGDAEKHMSKRHLFNHLFDYSAQSQTAKMASIAFFKKLKYDFEHALKKEMYEMIMILPSWIGLSDRNSLRDRCKVAGIEKLTLFTESSLTAFFNIILTHQQQKCYFLAVIVNFDTLRLEIFRESEEGVQLIAVACESWPQSSSEGGSVSRSSGIKALAKGVNSMKLSLTADGILPKSYMEVVKATYARALDQIIPGYRANVKYYAVLSDLDRKGKVSLHSFFKKEIGLEKLKNIRNPERYLEVFNFFASRPEEIKKFSKTLASVPKFEVLAEALQSTIRGSQIQSSQNDPNTGNSKRKELLLQKCASMEQQLENKTVDVANLTKKIIIKAIHAARLAANNNSLGGPEETRVNEMFQTYKFK